MRSKLETRDSLRKTMEPSTNYRLSFADVVYHGDGLFEVAADNGIEVTVKMLGELTSLLDELAPRPMKRALLSNRKHSYSFSFEALPYAARLKAVDAFAIQAHSRITMVSASIFKPLNFPFQVFLDRDEAIDWLRNRIT